MPLYFPGWDGQQETDPNEFKFRDGKRIVEPYIGAILGSIDTERYTYDEALGLINDLVMSDYLNRAQTSAVANHFRKLR